MFTFRGQNTHPRSPIHFFAHPAPYLQRGADKNPLFDSKHRAREDDMDALSTASDVHYQAEGPGSSTAAQAQQQVRARTANCVGVWHGVGPGGLRLSA